MSANDNILRMELLLKEAFDSLGERLPGWEPQRVGDRLLEIERFARINTFMPAAYRRIKAAEARANLGNPHFVANARPAELESLRWLAEQFPVQSGRGGDRRGGYHNVRASVLRMAVRLYMDATGRRGFSWTSPLIKFCDSVSQLVIADRRIEVTADMVSGTLRRLRKELPPPRPLRALRYPTMETAAGRKRSPPD